MKIYTKTGDNGETSLFGGKRVSKDSLRIDAYGTVDELNSQLGLILALDEHNWVREHLSPLQSDLFILGADLASPEGKAGPKITALHVEKMEQLIDSTEKELAPLKSFILPGGSPLGAQIHVARTVCRRAERIVVALSMKEEIGNDPIVFLNRLSDLLFVTARMVNVKAGSTEVPWHAPA